MPAPTAAWALARVYGTFVDQDSTPSEGTYKFTVPVRIVNTADDVIVQGGTFATGNLSTTPGGPSIDVQVPVTDDPDNNLGGWKVKLEVTISGKTDTYYLDVPYADRPIGAGGTGDGVNLADVVFPSEIPTASPTYRTGVPGGLCLLNLDGNPVDADGNEITGGGGGGGGPIDADDITDATTTGKALVRAASASAARSAIGATDLTLGTTGTTAAAGNDSRLTNTRTPTDGTVTDAKVASGAGIAQSKIAGLTTDLAGKAPTVHGHAISDVTGLETELDEKAPLNHAHDAGDITGTLAWARIPATAPQMLPWNGSAWPSRTAGRIALWIGGTEATPPPSPEANDIWIRDAS